MNDPAGIAHYDQLEAATTDALATLANRYADAAASLRAQITEGSITRADAIQEIRSRFRGRFGLTDFGAADILDRAGTADWAYPRRTAAGLPPLTTMDDVN